MESTAELIERLNAMDESSKIEAKKGSSVDRSIMETICAFSNEPGLDGGYILLGVECDELSLFPTYTVTGISDPDKIQLDLASQCASMFNTVIRPEIEVDQINGKNVIKVFVPELPIAQKPVYFAKDGLPKGAFRRIGSSDQRCSEDDLIIFYNQAETFDNVIVQNSSLDDIDENAISHYRNLRSKVNPFAEELNYEENEY